MHILLTRPLEDCSEMILKFQSLGHQVSHLPLLKINKINHDEINFSNFKGIVFTSANAVKFIDLKKLIKKFYVSVLVMPQKKKLGPLVFKILFQLKEMLRI